MLAPNATAPATSGVPDPPERSPPCGGRPTRITNSTATAAAATNPTVVRMVRTGTPPPVPTTTTFDGPDAVFSSTSIPFSGPKSSGSCGNTLPKTLIRGRDAVLGTRRGLCRRSTATSHGAARGFRGQPVGPLHGRRLLPTIEYSAVESAEYRERWCASSTGGSAATARSARPVTITVGAVAAPSRRPPRRWGGWGRSGRR